MTESLHIERAGEFSLPFPFRQALAYLTPEGERAWVPGWRPVYLHPAAPSTTPGTVFQTNHNSQDTTWLILDFDPAGGLARYGRFSQNSHVGTVSVKCDSDKTGTTRVRVSYSLTSTTPAGVALLTAMTDAQYAAMLKEWRDLILAVHAREPLPAI
jgi:hypothetical protein